MEELYQSYKDTAAIYIVYISEAHALDDAYPVGYAKRLGIKEHTTFGERCTVASRLVADKKLTIPCLVDHMNNRASNAYQAWPDRIYVIRKDGTLAVAGHRGPWGFAPALKAAEQWLAAYKRTGREPPPVELKDTRGRYRALARAMGEAYQSGDYAKALEVAEKLHGQNPKDLSTIYNIACLHCLLGDKEKAYTWLERAVESGYDDAEHLSGDTDFKSIRDEPRFQNLVERVREQARHDPQAAPDGADHEPAGQNGS